MRLLIDSLIVVMLIGILISVLLHHRGQQQHHDQLAQAREALARLHEQVLYRDALASGATDTDTDAAKRVAGNPDLERKLHQRCGDGRHPPPGRFHPAADAQRQPVDGHDRL